MAGYKKNEVIIVSKQPWAWLNGTALDLDNYFNNGDRKIAALKPLIYPDGKNVLETRRRCDSSDADMACVYLLVDEIHIYADDVRLFNWDMQYGRMDRRIKGTVFTLRAATRFYGAMGLKRIAIVEPHSYKMLDIIQGTRIKSIPLGNEWLHHVREHSHYDKIVFPDDGAYERYGYGQIPEGDIIRLNKERHPETGKIIKIWLESGTLNPGDKVLIMDDVCDTGETLLWAIKLLKEMGAGEIYIWVVHLLPIKFNRELVESPLVKGVYSTPSYVREPHEKVTDMLELIRSKKPEKDPLDELIEKYLLYN